MKFADSSQRQLIVGFGVLAPLVVNTSRLALLAMGASHDKPGPLSDHVRTRRPSSDRQVSLLTTSVQALSLTVTAGTCITQTLLSEPGATRNRWRMDSAQQPPVRSIGELRNELARLIGHVRFLADSVNVVASLSDPTLNLMPRAYDASSQEVFAGAIRDVDQLHLKVERLSLADEPGQAALLMPALAEQSAQTARDIRTLALGESRRPAPSETGHELSHTMHDVVEQLLRMTRLIGELTVVPNDVMASPWLGTHAH